MAASKPKYSLGSTQVCKTHDLPIDMLCKDCDEFICAKCATTGHKEHEWSIIPTSATQRRRGLPISTMKIKIVYLPWIDEKLEKISKQLTENEELCDSEIKILQKHDEDVMARLIETRKKNVQKLRDNLEEKNKKLNSVKSELNKKKKEILKYMEENTMSDYGFIDNHQELSKKLSSLDVDIKNCKHSVIYRIGEISNEMIEKMIGKTLDLDDFRLTETSSVNYRDNKIVVLRALCEDQCYIKQLDNIEQVTKEGEKKHKYDIKANDMCVTDTGDVYFTDSSNNSIGCLSPSGSVSTVISTDPLGPWGICQSVDGGLLVTLRNKESYLFILDSLSRHLVRHITVTGDVIHEYEYQEDGQTRLFTVPIRVTQNSNRDICVANGTSDMTGELVILSPSGRMKSVYRGQNLTGGFSPTDVVCDSLCNILVTDVNNKKIHLLSPDGEFLKFLLSENGLNLPFRLSLYKSTLWVGYCNGVVKVFQYRKQYT